MNHSQENQVRRWLDHIQEHDEEMRAIVLRQCRHDKEALVYYVGQAAKLPPPGKKKKGPPQPQELHMPPIQRAAPGTRETYMKQIRTSLPCRKRQPA